MNLSLPNLLSLLRMGLIPFFIIAVIDAEPKRALAIFLLAGVTDALDGFIARFFDQMTVLGTYLDPIADKLLISAAYVMLAVPGLYPGVEVPVWVTVLVLARDVLILVLALVLFLALGISRFRPTALSKVNTTLQIVTVGFVLASGLTSRLDPLTETLVFLVAGSTVLSGVDYIYRANRMAALRAREET